MRNKVSAKAAARFFAAAALAVSGVLFVAGSAAPTQAYSGSQAEAQSDPRSADPYSFPNIDLCCKKKWRKRWRRNPPNDGPGEDDTYGGRYPNGSVRVSCGKPRRESYSSIGEALEHVREGGRIVVLPGAPCSISGVTIDRDVSIESSGYESGMRATLVGDACASISPPYGSSSVLFRGVDIEGCLVLQNGSLAFDRVNLTWRGAGDAVRLRAGAFSSTDSTIRALDAALNAEHAAMVSASGSRFASNWKASHVLRLNVGGANFKDTLIKGGKVGVYIDMQGRHPVTFHRVQVQRGDGSEIRRHGLGERGIVVGGGGAEDDLPSLPDFPSAEFSMDEGGVTGYKDGVVIGPDVRANVRRTAITLPVRGIVAESGARVELHENRISRSQRVGISLDAGVQGTASFNNIQCDDGDCVCYGGDCTSRSYREFGHGAFRMSGTHCND